MNRDEAILARDDRSITGAKVHTHCARGFGVYSRAPFSAWVIRVDIDLGAIPEVL